MARMVSNVVIDAAVGAIPFIGDLFGFGFKANSHNLQLMQEHYAEGRHRGSAEKILIPVLVLLLLIMGGVIWLVNKGLSAFFSYHSGSLYFLHKDFVAILCLLL